MGDAFAERLQQLISDKNYDEALYGECWAIVDNTLVIYEEGFEPAWLIPVLATRDEDGNTE